MSLAIAMFQGRSPSSDSDLQLRTLSASKRHIDGGVDFGGPAATAWARVRSFMLVHVVTKKWFDSSVLLLILINCVFLALDNPLDDPASPKQRLLVAFDTVPPFYHALFDTSAFSRFLCSAPQLAPC